MELLNSSVKSFTEQLASKAPVPGGGGASALVGAIGVALGDMVGELDIMIENEMADPEELNMMLSGLKEMRFSFDLVELNEPIAKLEEYLKENR